MKKPSAEQVTIVKLYNLLYNLGNCMYYGSFEPPKKLKRGCIKYAFDETWIGFD